VIHPPNTILQGNITLNINSCNEFLVDMDALINKAQLQGIPALTIVGMLDHVKYGMNVAVINAMTHYADGKPVKIIGEEE
jgi:hypothetical protein